MSGVPYPWITPQRLVHMREASYQFLTASVEILRPNEVRDAGSGRKTTVWEVDRTIQGLIAARRQTPQVMVQGSRATATTLYDLYAPVGTDIPNSWRVRSDGVEYDIRAAIIGTDDVYDVYALEQTP